jgi:hypothetical protein
MDAVDIQSNSLYTLMRAAQTQQQTQAQHLKPQSETLYLLI